MLSTEIFKELYPNCKDPKEWVQAMNNNFGNYNITTPERIAAFISQCGHESGGWRIFEENLNYSAEALNRIFPKYFKNAGRNAYNYDRQPQKIANVVYANRMGNNNFGDGYTYRGRGPIQLTGKENYYNFSKFSGHDVVKNPDLVKTNKDIAILSAIWFWEKNNLNSYADKNDIKGMTKRINGGYIGLDSRISHYQHAIKLLNNKTIQVDSSDENEKPEKYLEFGVLKRNSQGDGVKFIQELLGLTPDGWFGKYTEQSVKFFQSNNGLLADGIVGPKTIEIMLKKIKK